MTDIASRISLDDLTGPDAARVLAGLRESAPVAWVPALGGWLVTGHAVALEVMRDAEAFTVDHPAFSTARVVGPSMLSTDGAVHHRHRRPFGHAFGPSQLDERFAGRTLDLARELVDRVRPAGRADLRSALAGPLSVGVVTAALGLRAADAPTVLRWYAAIVGAVTDLTAGRPARTEATAAMTDLDAAVREAAAHDGDSLLAAARPALHDAEITSNAAVLMFGGIETTEAMIVNALLHLLRHPPAWDAVRRDRTLIGAAVEESLRLEPAAAVVDRYATEDIALGSAAIARGELVRVSLAAANRDPAVFERPDTFEPGRPGLDAQVAFARGPHTCIAMDLARLETRTAIDAVLDGLPDVRLDGAAEVTGLVFRKAATLPVAWDASVAGDASAARDVPAGA